MTVEHHYMALNVKNIDESYQFYSQLGFEPIENGGSLEENWIILKNGNCKIGLFQGILRSNTLTFHPDNAREFNQAIKYDYTVGASSGMDDESGPCYFMITDPDGNQLLFDQDHD